MSRVFRGFLRSSITISILMATFSEFNYSTKIIAALTTKLKTFSARDLATIKQDKWRQKRQEREKLRNSRLQQRHFRKDPDKYLTELETELLQAILPP